MAFAPLPKYLSPLVDFGTVEIPNKIVLLSLNEVLYDDKITVFIN